MVIDGCEKLRRILDGLDTLTSLKKIKIIGMPVEFEHRLRTNDLPEFKYVTPTIESSMDILSIGTTYGSLGFPKLIFSQGLKIRAGVKKISILSVAVGFPNVGPHFERWKTGVFGLVTLVGLNEGKRDLTWWVVKVKHRVFIYLLEVPQLSGYKCKFHVDSDEEDIVFFDVTAVN
ncbi:hypothetical protein PIB30_035871 [Stylosanthes scabra]|uniref:Uncharacterized protein n=1 Tax=Stylosanthes scabra TaxID=79078 RepID=A0ABU6SDI0_9FABA|nr:hypothetical protein [Stylosanthes scabra]